ncbi:hypothetical protein ES703_11520 [subsurface metagenome]
MGKNIMAVVMGIIAIAIAFVVFPIVLDATGDLLAHTGDALETAQVTTGAAEETADVVLTYELYEGDVLNVRSITSTEPTDVPVANTYTEATRTLNITGLAVDLTRTLNITYETVSTNVYTGLGSIVKVAPLIVFVGLLAGGGFAMFKGVTGIRKRETD